MDYKEARKFVEEANAKAGEMGTESIASMLEEMGNPQKHLKFVHVGGTNGKGSVSTYVATILAAAGYKVGRYVSPTIKGYRERIQTLEFQQGERKVSYIPEEKFVALTEQVRDVYRKKEAKGEILPSTFELETVISFLYFKEVKCDVVILEVGLGGRLDATNVIEQSECTVFTSISMDHMQILGDTLEAITREKSGIIKEKGQIVAYDFCYWSEETKQKDVITKILQEETAKRHGEIVFSEFKQIRNENHSIDGITFDYKEYKDMYTPLIGENQVKNAALAIEVAEQLQKKGWKIDRDSIDQGLKHAVWEGRFQVVRKNPYYVLDGAHNADAARSLAKSLQLYFPKKKLLFIVGLLADKEYEKVLSITAPLAEKVLTVTPDNPRALPAKDLAKVARKYCANVEVKDKMEEALETAKNEEENYDAIIVFGSLYSLHLVYEYLE